MKLIVTDLPKIVDKFDEVLDSLDSFKGGNCLSGSEDYGDFIHDVSQLLVLGQCIKELKDYGETSFTEEILNV